MKPEPDLSSIPRRARKDQFTPAEELIFDASQVVEAMGADPRLTAAVVLLSEARRCVADFVDGVPHADLLARALARLDGVQR